MARTCLPKDTETTDRLDIERWENDGGRSVSIIFVPSRI